MITTPLAWLLFLAALKSFSTHPMVKDQLINSQSLEAVSVKQITPPQVAEAINEVQKLLQRDLSLPRLTRGEIEDLFEQVTNEEYAKGLKEGDMNRADNMRALMLVLPYNINNKTEDNLQELYTRPPVTKVIDSYSLPHPQKIQSPVITPPGNVDLIDIGNLVATTYKPPLQLKEHAQLSPTTYHPTQVPLKMSNLGTTTLPLLPDIEDPSKLTRYSSSYNAEDNNWSLISEDSLNRNKPYTKLSSMDDFSQHFQNFQVKMHSSGLTKLRIQDYDLVGRPSLSTYKQSERYPETTDFTRTLPPRPKTEAYSQFKPLNIGEEIRVQPDIEMYLNRFGIVNRKRKQIKPEDSLKNIEGNLVSTTTLLPRKQEISKRIDMNIQNTQDDKDFVQINKLLYNLRELEHLNISLTPEMFKSVNFNVSSNIHAQGTDPVINIADSDKNGKRQSATEFNSSPTKINLTLTLSANDDFQIGSTTTTNRTSSTTEESRNGSFADLEDSFGGPDPITEDPNPPPKKNGFYFLADWNSFLEVGEPGNDQVVVRFDPKIGDPRRFLKVTVP